MKFLFALLLAAPLFLGTSCGEGKEKDPKPKKENLVEIKDGVYTEYYPGRTAVKFQGPQDKNGQRDGRWFFYAENGTEQSTTEYSNGKKSGLIMVRYPTGNVRYTGFYENDKEAGAWRFYKEDGSLDFEKDFGTLSGTATETPADPKKNNVVNSPHIVDEIIQTARIEEVIGEFVSLKRAGSNLKGMSPFVDEKTPSFMVSPAKQIYKCFSSSKGGNVVSFLMEKEHYSYPEALRWLADKYGIELPKEREQTAEELAAVSERESLYIINEFAKDHFMSRMKDHPEGQAIGLSYFEERGFRKDIIEKFQLGYCLNSGNDFTESSLAKGYKKEYLEKVGLVKTKDERSFDFFRGRVMFPIHSVSGRVLGFGGRTLQNDKKIAKYFNSPESIIYNKSEILYGLFFSKGDIIKYDNCFLCEGYTDVISMYQAGVTNVVASSGTSLTKEQIKLIKRYTNNITILYDGDAAGIKASFRGIDLILEEGLNVKVMLFPDGDDPDSYSKKVSTSELIAFIAENTQDFVSFKTSLLLEDSGNDPIKKAGLIKDIVQSISLIPDQITRSVYSKDIAKQFGIDEAIVLNELNNKRKTVLSREHQEPQIRENDALTDSFTQAPEQQITKPKDPYSHEEYDLLRVLVKYGEYAIQTKHMNEHNATEEVEVSVTELIVHELLKDELTFKYPLFQRIFNHITEGLESKTLYKTSYWMKHPDQEIVQWVVGIESDNYELSPQWLLKYNVETAQEVDKLKKLIYDSLFCFKNRVILDRNEEINVELQITIDEGNFEKMMDLLSEQIVLNRIKQEISNQLGRIILP